MKNARDDVDVFLSFEIFKAIEQSLCNGNNNKA